MTNYDDNGAATVRRTSKNPRSPQQGHEETGAGHFIFYGFIAFLCIACIAAAINLFSKINNSTANKPALTPIFALAIVIYIIACVGAGWYWGRYQNQAQAEQEKMALRKEISRLTSENRLLESERQRLEAEKATLQKQIKAAQLTPALPPVPAQPATSTSPLAPVAQLKPIQQIAPANLYDSPPREPDDPSDLPLHPHEKVFPARGEQNTLTFNWRIAGASRRGYGHAYEGKYREDDFNVRIYNGNGKYPAIAMVAIADGVSSKQLSRRGARAAVMGATSLPAESMRRLWAVIEKRGLLPDYSEISRGLLLEALQQANYSVQQAAERSQASIEDLQSTLQVFLVMPCNAKQLIIASTQIGDGALFAFQQNPARWSWVQQPQIQSAGNEVQPFMRSRPQDWEKYFQCDLLDDVKCIMGMTDGTADDIEPPRPTREKPNPDPFAKVHDFYERIILPSFTHQFPGEELVHNLGYKKRSSFDDRTVVCVYH